LRQARLGEAALAALLVGLGGMDRRWGDLHPDVRQTLTEGLVVSHVHARCTPQVG